MTDLDLFNLCKAQYEAIDGKRQEMADAIRRDVPADQVSHKLMQLALAWDQAHLNYMTAGNTILDANNQAIKDLAAEAQSAQESIEQSLADLQKVAAILDQITSAVGLVTSLVGMGTPKAG